jgi:hypothetical protein
MSERETRAPERNVAAWGTHIIDSMWEFVRGRWIVRWVALLYSLYFFVMPAYRHSFAVWMEFAVLYAVFLILYFLVAELTGRWQTVAFVLFFLHASITRLAKKPMECSLTLSRCFAFSSLVCAPCSWC